MFIVSKKENKSTRELKDLSREGLTFTTDAKLTCALINNITGVREGV